MTRLLPSIVLSYLLGAIPTPQIVARVGYHLDLRRVGSGHTGATNLARATGRLWVAIGSGLIDVGWGALAVILAKALGQSPWIVALACPMALLGHNWSIYLALGGGVGLSTLLGGLLVQAPSSTVIAISVLGLVWLAARRILDHDARATIIVLLPLPLFLWGLGEPLPVVASGGLGALLAIIKSLGDWRRIYEPHEGVLGQLGTKQPSND